MLDNSFQNRYNKLPIATYAAIEPAQNEPQPFVLPHHHCEFEVIVITSGQCTITIDQENYFASSGDILLIPPYSVHSGIANAGAVFSHFCFCFDLSLLQTPNLIHQLDTGYLQLIKHIPSSAEGASQLYTVAQTVYRHSESRNDGWELVVRGGLIFFFGLLQTFRFAIPTAQGSSRSGFCIQVLEELSHNYAWPLTSRDMAASLSYSHGYFCRLFHENFNTSFQQYLNQYRLSKARLLLSSKTTSIGDVAIQVGFSSSSYFCHQFRLQYGCTPKQFQTMCTPVSELHHYCPDIINRYIESQTNIL